MRPASVAAAAVASEVFTPIFTRGAQIVHTAPHTKTTPTAIKCTPNTRSEDERKLRLNNTETEQPERDKAGQNGAEENM